MKKNKKIHMTNVSPLIMRQIPQYTNLTNLKRLNASVSIDYLSINVNTINKSFIQDISYKKYITSNRVFKKIEVFEYQGKEYSISSDKTFFKQSDEKNEFKFQIKLNPSYFKEGQEVRKLLELISPDILTEDHQIARLDISFALSDQFFSPLLVSTMCHFKWKRTSTDFRQNKKSGKVSGIQCPGGAMSTSIYLHDLVNRKSHFKKHHITEENMTIFEVQLKHASLNKIGLHNVFELQNFDWKKVFNKFNFYDVISFKKNALGNLEKIEYFQDDVRTMGFQHARIQYNRMNNRNFMRDIGKSMLPLKINQGKVKLISCLRFRFQEYLIKWNPWSSNILNSQ